MRLTLSKTTVVAASLVVALSLPLVASAVNNNDTKSAKMFRDGSISCTGADDRSRKGGEVVVLPQPDKVQFKVKLRNAQPNTDYRLAVSREPNCANAQFFDTETTNNKGNADFYGTYDVQSGDYNLLFNIVATESVNNARNREIGTRNLPVTVP